MSNSIKDVNGRIIEEGTNEDDHNLDGFEENNNDNDETNQPPSTTIVGYEC